MKDINRIILLGNIGKDPDFRQTSTGESMCRLSVATNSNYKKGDEWVKTTTWHSVQVWRDPAAKLQGRIHKGSRVYIEGKLSTRKWKDEKTGQDRWVTDINCDLIEVIDAEKKSGDECREPSKQLEILGDDVPF